MNTNFRKIIVIVTLLIVAACSDDNDWYKGRWVIDEDLTKSLSNTASPENKEYTLRKLRKLEEEPIDFEVRGTSVEIFKPVSLVVEYQLARSENNKSVTLTNDRMKKVFMQRDDNGVFMVLNNRVKMLSGGKVISESTKTAKIYLKKK